MNWREHITVDPQILVGKPIIKGTRMSVEFVIDLWGLKLWLPNNLDVSGGHPDCPHRIEWLSEPSY